VPAELLGDRLHPAGRHPLHVQLGQRRHPPCLLRVLIAFEQLGREAAVAVLRHPQLQLADPGDQRAAVIAAPVAEPHRGPLALLGAKRLRHLRFQQLLQHGLDSGRRKSRSSASSAFTSSSVPLSLPRGMVCTLRGDVEHHPHTMTLPFRRFCRTSRTRPASIALPRAVRLARGSCLKTTGPAAEECLVGPALRHARTNEKRSRQGRSQLLLRSSAACRP
jgi:hypothetical protein